MGRKKILVKKIDDDRVRAVTFRKRKEGLFKKAMELSILCNAKISLMIFSENDTLHEYCSTDSRKFMEKFMMRAPFPHEVRGNKDYERAPRVREGTYELEEEGEEVEKVGKHDSFGSSTSTGSGSGFSEGFYYPPPPFPYRYPPHYFDAYYPYPPPPFPHFMRKQQPTADGTANPNYECGGSVASEKEMMETEESVEPPKKKQRSHREPTSLQIDVPEVNRQSQDMKKGNENDVYLNPKYGGNVQLPSLSTGEMAGDPLGLKWPDSCGNGEWCSPFTPIPSCRSFTFEPLVDMDCESSSSGSRKRLRDEAFPVSPRAG